jgi:hypothetical protein
MTARPVRAGDPLMNHGSAGRGPFGAHWLALDLIGVAMLAAGILGLTGAGAQIEPRLGDPRVAWALTGAGAAVVACAALAIVRELRARAQPGRSSRTSR